MNVPSDTYKSISAPSQGIYKSLGSKFIAFAFPVETESEAKEKIAAVKKEYFDARHHCYAYRIGRTGELWRANDDGEPSSTAGRPILGQLLSNELSDVLIVVVRYFGGTKLGVPGLIKAYRTAAQEAVANSETVEKISCETLAVSFEYGRLNDVMKVLKDLGVTILRQNFDLKCEIVAKVRLSQVEPFRSLLDFCEINCYICESIGNA